MSFLLLLPIPLLPTTLQEAAEEIVQAGIFLNRFGLCPATAGNFSRRLDENLIAVTISGKHKGELTVDDVIVVNLEGKPQGTIKTPSAETLLHTLIYSLYPDAGAALHTHSANGVVLTRLLRFESTLVTEGYEMHKVFGIPTHESTLIIPIFENSQDYLELSAEVTDYLRQHPKTFGLLLRGHGFYTWGRDMKETRNRVEAFEHIFECELKQRTVCSK